MHRYYCHLILLCLVALGGVVRADEVALTNGDRLTGTIVKMTDGKLLFKSPSAGEVTIPFADVQTLSSSAPVTLLLSDGTILVRKVQAGQPRQIVIAAEGAVTSQVIPLTSVAAINLPPKPEAKWTGSVTGAVTSTSGNTQSQSIAASLSLVRRAEVDRIIIGADYGKNKQTDRTTKVESTTEDWWKTKAEYDYFFTKQFFGFANGRYEKDAIADLDRRVVIGGGGGYQWIETDRTSLATTLGLASMYEKYDVDPPLDDSRSEVTLQAGYTVDHKITDTLRFVHDLTYYPNTKKFSDYFLTSSAELRANLTASMFANFKVLFSYDKTPAPGLGNTDIKYILGVGINF
jgi:putative salt-induced outer membrane protein YdiY